ncbi:penicillin-binding protein activator [Chitinimonas sp. BJYL2]|uniref:penicillin-binding protein activator n=1 Tax=Chitinimonas sp. BJYL2 TaxID=2976696 RepID=UPI0022B4532E|nr:penicillin-binding protein activator [Chitinimonas sp. BJYL2]
MHDVFTSHWLPRFAAALLYLGTVVPASAEDTPAPPAEDESGPHIALILPTKSKGLAGAAEVVQAGVLAAQLKLGDESVPKIRLYPTGDRDEEALMAYRQAAVRGAVGVIGPLTRGAIGKLAGFGKLDIPVLALNSLESAKPPTNLFVLGLSVETEARQIARQMKRDGIKQPLVLEAEGALHQRMRDAFVAEWKTLGGTPPQQLALPADPNALWKLRDAVNAQTADALFLAADLKRARMARPFLSADRPQYATSQVWGGKFGKTSGANIDMLGVKFVDMPWLLEPHHPDIAAFKRSERPLSAELERLYALGIDAYRLTMLLLVSAPGATIEVQGVTGTLKLAEGRQFSRELMAGIVGGQPSIAAPKPEVSDPAPAEATAESATQ